MDDKEQAEEEGMLRGYYDVPDDSTLRSMSDVALDALLLSSKANQVKSSAIEREIQRRRRKWYEKPTGIILVSLISGLLLAGAVFFLGWR